MLARCSSAIPIWSDLSRILRFSRWSCELLLHLRSRSGAAQDFAVRSHHLHKVEMADRILLEALHHCFEHVEGLALVFNERVVLAITTQPDSLLEVVHVQQVVFP